jgi:hypothetical protein
MVERRYPVERDRALRRPDATHTVPGSDTSVSQKHICIYLRDRSLYPPNTRRGRALRRGWNFGLGDITMMTVGLDRNIPELMAAIRKHAVPAGVEVTE